jgi:Tetratricopeptide repeat
MHNLAISYSEVGRRQEALELTEKVVAARERTLGEEHPDTLDSMDCLANHYSEVGRRQETLELARRVAAVRKRALGEGHQDTLLSHGNMTIFEEIPGPSAESPWQHSDSKKGSSNHTTDRLKGKQKTSTRRFWRKLILIRRPSVP